MARAAKRASTKRGATAKGQKRSTTKQRSAAKTSGQKRPASRRSRRQTAPENWLGAISTLVGTPMAARFWPRCLKRPPPLSDATEVIFSKRSRRVSSRCLTRLRVRSTSLPKLPKARWTSPAQQPAFSPTSPQTRRAACYPDPGMAVIRKLAGRPAGGGPEEEGRVD